MILSHRAANIKPSPTLSISALAKRLQSEGKDLINLSIGEPDFDTPEHIKAAAEKAIKDGMTKYTAVDGIPELKKAVIHKFEKDNQLSYSMKEVMASNGCKQALCNVIFALINLGDEVIIPSPYWVSYEDMVNLAEGKCIFIPTDIQHQFKISPQQLESAITPRTKLLMLNSPSNPTGMVYSESELTKLAEVLLRHPHVYIISDDIYEHIRWTGKPFKNIVNVCPELKSRTIICHGVAKTYAMTGWRIGYAAGPENIITAMSNIQSQYTSSPNTIAQYAVVEALMGSQDCVENMRQTYENRHQIICDGLNKIPGFQCAKAEGAFYAFPDISGVLKNKSFVSDTVFSEFLLNEAGVVVVPGSAFGNPSCIRFSYAADEKLIQEALVRIQKAL